MKSDLKINRRSFLKRLGAGGAGAIVFSTLPARSVFGAPANSRLNLALIGCGGRMRQLLPSLLESGENILALCEVNPRNVTKLQSEAPGTGAGMSVHSAKVYDDYRKLLASERSVDAVVIAAGQRWHVPMSKAALLAGKHVFCEKPLAHSAVEAREIRELARNSKLVTQVGTQGGSSATFRRSMELVQAGGLGHIREVHCWINRSFPPSAPVATDPDPIPEGLNWDFWCGPSPMLPFKQYYLGGCLAWGRWLAFGDGHLADMGAHAINLPYRALKLGPPQRVSVEIPEVLKDSYPSANTFRWEFATAAGAGNKPLTLFWHDGVKAGPPQELGNELLSTYDKVPTNGVLFAGEKGMLFSDAWGVGGMVRLNGEPDFKPILQHPGCKGIPTSLPAAPKNHMREYLDACKGGQNTFQGFVSSADIAEVAMVGMISLRYGKPIEWDSAQLKVKGEPAADPLVRLEQRKKWL